MSVLRMVANTERATQGYVNILALGSTTSADTFDATGAVISGGAITDGATAGQVLVRDMGKTIRVPQLGSVVNTAGSTKYRLLRKVQLVHTASMDYASTNSGNSNTDGVYSGSSKILGTGAVFYIELGGNTVSGAVAVSGGLSGCKWARVSIPN